MKVIACIEDQEIIDRILAHLRNKEQDILYIAYTCDRIFAMFITGCWPDTCARQLQQLRTTEGSVLPMRKGVRGISPHKSKLPPCSGKQ